MSTSRNLPAHTPRVVYVVLDGYKQAAGVYSTHAAAKANKGLWGAVVAYVPRRKAVRR